MADQRRIELNPVITPAGTDILAVRQSGDTRDKRETITQLLSLVVEVNDLTAAVVWANIPQANIPDPLLMGDGSAAAPSYSFSATGQQDVGFYRSETDGVSLALGGVAQAHWTFNLAAISGVGSDRPAMRSVSASATVPSLTPRNDDSNTGIGRADPDQLSLIAGGVEGLRVTEAAAVITIQTLGQIQAISGTLAAPGISFAGDSGSGLQLGGDKWDLISVGTLIARVDGNRESFMVTSGSVSEPGLAFITDANVGIDSSGIDELSLIAGGKAGLVLKELNSGVVQVPIADVAITAFATGGQGSAVALKQSYNVISVCATAGDSVKLPSVFNVNSIVYIKNDGANSADVFPATGDDLGQGLDTAEALASGVSAAYIATAASATWTLLLASAGGVPDPLLLSDGSAVAPSYSFVNASTSGLFRPSANKIEMSIAGTSRFIWDANFFMGKVANAPLMQNVSSSATVPNFLPSNSDLNTGLGRAGTDQLSLIAGGVEIAQAKEVVGANQFIIAPGVIQNAAATPSLAFGDGDSGIFEPAANILKVALAGVARFEFNGDVFQSENTSGPAMRNNAVGANPQFCPNQNDLNTGIGQSGQDELTVIVGGVEGMRFVETNATDMLISYKADVGQTASVTQTQGNGLIGGTYNEFSTVANSGDTATLPVDHELGTQIYIKNNGANDMQIFPSINDAIDGLGTNNPLSLPAGGSVLFMTITGSNVWTAMFVDGSTDPLLLSDGTAAAPVYAFSSTTGTGFFIQTADVLGIASGGVQAFAFDDASFVGFVTSAGAVLNETATSINPVLSIKGDFDTGIGWAGIDQLSLIAGAIEGIRLTELNSGVIQAPASDLVITAFAGGGQASAVALKQSYNRVSVCATTADSIKLPATFAVFSIVKIRNDGANACDVFPASGDDLGAGANTAASLAAGASITYIALTANATWTPFE